MKNQKILSITSRKKKQICITGTLSVPLHAGEQAWIFTTDRIITTSTVTQILEVSDTGVVFETRNTIYQLTYLLSFQKTEVICA